MNFLRKAAPYVNGALIFLFGFSLFFWPALTLISDLSDPALQGRGVPKAAWRLFTDLTPQYERWARERLASGRAKELAVNDISGTEWPLFGSVFYLLAVEELQKAWEKDKSLYSQEPRIYARQAVEEATKLVFSEDSAAWVKKHWGADYLHKENCFYRMMLIFAAAVHQDLTGAKTYDAQLRDQTETLAKDIDQSPHGWIVDYPHECYPTDVLAAIAAIARADKTLGTDHSKFVERAKRGFQGDTLDKRYGLPPYSGHAPTGKVEIFTRGCGVSYAVMFGNRIWPKKAQEWMDLYVKHFWQHKWLFWGFREYPKDIAGYDWGGDVDAGPIIAGHGVAACAFGVAAARATGRFDVAWPLTAEMLVSCWPTPWGAMLAPRFLSNAVDAPLLGEACCLFCLATGPKEDQPISHGGELAGYVYILLAAYLALGALFMAAPFLRHRRRQRAENQQPPRQVTLIIWVILVGGAIAAAALGQILVTLLLLLLAQLPVR